LPELDAPALIISLLILIFSLSVHEAAHAWSASRLGDDTARRLGRVSLNPIVHTDPIGTLNGVFERFLGIKSDIRVDIGRDGRFHVELRVPLN